VNQKQANPHDAGQYFYAEFAYTEHLNLARVKKVQPQRSVPFLRKVLKKGAFKGKKKTGPQSRPVHPN
jgi:hypothetical protein